MGRFSAPQMGLNYAMKVGYEYRVNYSDFQREGKLSTKLLKREPKSVLKPIRIE